MELNFRRFVNYLFEKGIVSIRSIHDFLDIYKNKVVDQSSKRIRIETLQKIIYEYFENIDEEALYELCRDIIMKYIDAQNSLKIKQCIKLKKIYSKFSDKLKVDKLCKWKCNAVYSNLNLNVTLKDVCALKTKLKVPQNNLFLNKKKVVEVVNHEQHLNKTKSKEYLMNSPLKSLNDSVKSTGEDDSNRIANNNARFYLIREKDKKSDRKVKSKSVYENNSADCSCETKGHNSSILIHSFLDRQIALDNKAKSIRRKLYRRLESEESSNCTFVPKISKISKNRGKQTFRTQSVSVFQRFNKSLENQKKIFACLNETNHRSCDHKDRYIYCTKEHKHARIFDNPTIKKSFNKIKAESLYNDFKDRLVAKQKLVETVDKERGITFHPSTRENRYKKVKINTSFGERNDELINKRKERSKAQELLDSRYHRNKCHKQKNRVKSQEITERSFFERFYWNCLEKLKNTNKTDELERLEKSHNNFESNLRSYTKSGYLKKYKEIMDKYGKKTRINISTKSNVGEKQKSQAISKEMKKREKEFSKEEVEFRKIKPIIPEEGKKRNKALSRSSITPNPIPEELKIQTESEEKRLSNEDDKIVDFHQLEKLEEELEELHIFKDKNYYTNLKHKNKQMFLREKLEDYL